jgi:hypothetical protein
VPNIGTDGHVGGDGGHDVVDALIAFVVGVIHAGRVAATGQPSKQIGHIAVVHERPVVVAIPHYTHEAVGGGPEEVADHALVSPVDHPGPHDDGAKAVDARAQDEIFMIGPPGTSWIGLIGASSPAGSDVRPRIQVPDV